MPADASEPGSDDRDVGRTDATERTDWSPTTFDDRERDDDGQGDEGDSFGPEPNSTPVEPGDPTLENATFVLLGAISMVLVMLRLAALVPA
ncbi:hypothetical protein ACFOZ7_07385 [Natribaculum luteum]|uniref:DUF7312 domain-containing protein n=1 Tax=Natribaculum luteum TaxID=1586232 RepID=A0ABD5NXY0_9EURY|nr:hypothetical protein [Natribaculum luteum]